VHAVWKWCRAEGIQSSHPQGRAPVPLAEQERAVALVQQGATYNLAARQLRLSVASVRRWCLAAGVQSERQAAVRDPQRKARMQRQRAQGATLAEIGRRYGVSGERVRQILAAEARRQQKGQVK
jgi:DNA-binding CsgD family transcriptional regulator